MSAVALLKSNKTTAPALTRLQALVADDLAKVNRIILERLESSVALIPQLAGHIIVAGGKRLRPMLTLASARLCGHEGNRHVGLAASVEFIHTATLLHDDVVDESELRRGLATANALWGNKASVLVGDFLFSRAFQLMVEDGSLEVLRILSEASAVIAEGEVLELATSNDLETTEPANLRVIEAKTATLFAAACRIGAVAADRPKEEDIALAQFGMSLGIAFQLVDDVLDYRSVEATLGKTVGGDFREGKITLPVILAFRRGEEEERRFWRRTVQDLQQGGGDLDHAIGLLERRGALEDSLTRARSYGAAAREALAPFPEGEAKRALHDVIEFSIDRAY
ncbi:MAG: polyprenyl synthetase family protein [Alphaproteobacteria bacterium]